MVKQKVTFMRRVEIPDYAEPEKTYLRRWILIGRRGGRALYLHHILMPDDPARGFHDHPWAFISVRLWRRYVEHRYSHVYGWTWTERQKRFTFRRAEDLHMVEPEDPRGCWTLVYHGKKVRRWGFEEPGGTWVDHNALVHNYRVKDLLTGKDVYE